MRELAPEGPCYQAGTLSGNPLATAAGLAVLGELAAPGTYERLEELGGGARGGGGRQRPARDRQPGRLDAHPLLRRRAGPGLRRRHRERHGAYGRLARALLADGVYPPPSQFEAWFVGLTHDEAAIGAVRDALARAAATG